MSTIYYAFAFHLVRLSNKFFPFILGHVEVIKILMKHNGSLSARNKAGNNVFHNAAKSGEPRLSFRDTELENYVDLLPS